MLDIFLVFFRIGLVGFGGPIALIAMIEQEICHNKKWLSVDVFAEIFSICKLLPGPVAVQVAICCGYKISGRLGGFLAGVAFLLPALVMIIILGILYQHNLNTQSPHLHSVFEYMQVATIAVILITLIALAKSYVKNFTAAGLVVLATAIVLVKPAMEPLLIIGGGIFGVIVHKFSAKDLGKFPLFFGFPQLIRADTILHVGYSKLMQLFWVCIKAGEFSFGTGLAIIPLLHADIVTHYQWLNNQQFIDGITLGQITPGPTTISIVFFGFIIAGVKGLLISLLGFYLPPMFNTLVIIPLFWKKMANSTSLKIFTNWAFPLVIGGILSATIKIGVVSIDHLLDVVLLVVSFMLLYKKIIPIWLLIPSYGLIGLAMSYI